MKNNLLRVIAAAAFAAVILGLFLTRTYKYETSFYDVFDTYSTITVYARSRAEAESAAESVHTELVRLNMLFDKYNSYDGVNNLKTVNDNAGISPVTVDPSLVGLLQFSCEAYNNTCGAVNPAMGGVLEIWHDCREAALSSPENAALPDIDALKEAAVHSDISSLSINTTTNTVYIGDKDVSLDVGAVAKGFAADRAGELLRDMGIRSAMLNLGGNVLTIGKKPDGSFWNIGIQDPKGEGTDIVVHSEDGSVVTSGDYQRYFELDGVRYNHIIDGKTLMPAVRYASVSVMSERSAEADMLSTALFILPEDEGNKLADKYGVHIWRIYHDGTIDEYDPSPGELPQDRINK